jgi:hypothetical protein
LRSGRKIFLDGDQTVEFPIAIDRSKMIVHKIVVAHGAVEACRAFSDSNVYGSLAVSYGTPSGDVSLPFLVEIDKSQPFHLLDSHNLPIVLGELDTIFDLSSYLDAKIEAVQRYDGLVYCGEEDLLAHYFLNYDTEKNRHYIGTAETGYNGFLIGEGEWKDFIETSPYKRKKEADAPSYLWDEIIQKTARNALNRTLLGNSTLLRGQSAIHEMAKEPRFSRRALSTAMIGAIKNFPESSAPLVRNVSFMPSFYKGKAYVFLQLKATNIGDYDNDYRPKRQVMLEIACGAAKNKFPELDTVVGIAIDAPKYATKNAEDFVLMNCEDWTDETREHYERANEGFDFFRTPNLVMRKRTSKEFPDPERPAKASRQVKPGRNDPCPCGSGRKYKKCWLPQDGTGLHPVPKTPS